MVILPLQCHNHVIWICLRGNSYFNSFAGFGADSHRSQTHRHTDNLMRLLLTFARVKSPSALLPSQINKLPFVGHQMAVKNNICRCSSRCGLCGADTEQTAAAPFSLFWRWIECILDKLCFLVLGQFHSAVISLIDSKSAALLRNISNMLCGPV